MDGEVEEDVEIVEEELDADGDDEGEEEVRTIAQPDPLKKRQQQHEVEDMTGVSTPCRRFTCWLDVVETCGFFYHMYVYVPCKVY